MTGTCAACHHAKYDHPGAAFGCVKAIGSVRCPCWQYVEGSDKTNKQGDINMEQNKTLEQQAGKPSSGFGNTVLKDQKMHAAFTHVAEEWIKTTTSFEALIARAEEFTARCADLGDKKLKGITLAQAKAINEGVTYTLGEDAIESLSYYTGVPSRYGKKLAEIDPELFDANYNRGLARLESDKDVLLRTVREGDAVRLRVVLSMKYAMLNNLPVIKELAELVPGGRVSHLHYNGDTLRANILIPDTIRKESDSDYGGGISVLNNETGRLPFVQRPFLFRAICRNGCIWDRRDGVELLQYHRGSIDWAQFRQQIVLNVQRQVPLVQKNLEAMLQLKGVAVTADDARRAIVSLSQREKMADRAAQAWYEGFKTELAAARGAQGILNAFGIVQGLTRAAQDQGMEGQEQMEALAGRLVDGNWDRMLTASRSVEAQTVEKVLALK